MIRNLSVLLFLASGFARADFSYTMTSKASMGGNPSVSKYYFKGNKMKTETATSVIIMDFDAQTVTTINPSDKTYSVKPFSEITTGAAAGADVHADIKETGEHKTINGFNATQMLMTMEMSGAGGGPPGMKMQMEMEIWVSPDVPGVGDLRSFYQRNMAKFPWASLGEGTNPSMKAAMIDLQKKLAQVNGAPVLEVIHTKMSGGPQMSGAQNDKMAAARAQLEQMAKQGGQQGAAAQQALARMGAASGAASGGGMQITIEGGGYSAAPVPPAIFAVPGDFKQLK